MTPTLPWVGSLHQSRGGSRRWKGNEPAYHAATQMRALLAPCRERGPDLGFVQAARAEIAEQLIALPAGAPSRPDLLDRLARVMHALSDTTHDPADPDRAIEAARDSVTLMGDAHADAASSGADPDEV
jgi:hypothetical protein